jgi:hypothetical protein
MRAVRYARTGIGVDVPEVVDLPLPEPRAGQVRVRVEKRVWGTFGGPGTLTGTAARASLHRVGDEPAGDRV